MIKNYITKDLYLTNSVIPLKNIKIKKAAHNPWFWYKGTNIIIADIYIKKLNIIEFLIILVFEAPMNTPSRWNDKKDIMGDSAIQGRYISAAMITSFILVIIFIILNP